MAHSRKMTNHRAPDMAPKQISRPRYNKPSFLDDQPLSAIQAKEKAQLIAFGPVVFKVALALRNFGVLAQLEKVGEKGLSFEELRGKLELSEYGLRVLVDGGVQIGLIVGKDERLQLSSTGYYVLNDTMTRVNLDFVNDVWYRGLDHLEASVKTGKPEGLRELGPWPTIYEGLSKLPEGVRKSWLAFDHFYSDDAFGSVLPLVFRENPARILDIGGNTGKFTLQCLRHDPAVQVTLVDLPGQVELAKKNISKEPFADRASFWPADMLNPDVVLPTGADAIWMSQFLDCFSPGEIVNIFRACRRVMGPNTRVYVLEPLTDRQRFQGSEFVVQMTSLYFTNMANGNSRMYSSAELTRYSEEAGLQVREVISGLGICQSMMVFGLPDDAQQG
jgi:ubiquinone/menaquinone biosynthesis C-methylase UbiE